MKNIYFSLILCLSGFAIAAQSPSHDLQFNELPNKWDEAIPLGNGMLGALIWEKDENLRFSLDRADLWDMRPMKGMDREEFTYKWIYNQVKKNEYGIVQEYFDKPYDTEPGPTKIPGASLNFDTKNWGDVQHVRLHLKNAICKVQWANGTVLTSFVHATQPIGWFRFDNISSQFSPELLAPAYQGKFTGGKVNSVDGDDLARLGYKEGKIIRKGNSITYMQEGWGGFKYEVNVRWKTIGTSVEGMWSISSSYRTTKPITSASSLTQQVNSKTYPVFTNSHVLWWKNFWNKSTVNVPNATIEKQWYLEQYKFGSVARRGSPPISLQAVWTADNGRIPPWKGDFHHNLNTQLSYWPAYSGNHLQEALGYLDHLDENKVNYKRFTKKFFGINGLAVPGVTTLDGTEMSGWSQYSLSPTISAWLSQHYYLQWRYSMDKAFLKNRAYPWIKDVAIFLEKITVTDENGFRKLPISSSPEINDNDITAWFFQNTNYDLALMKYNFHIASELATVLGLKKEATHWKKIQLQFDDFALSPNNEMMFAPTMAYNQSHRHFSNAMAIHPLSLIKYEDGIKEQSIIKNTIHLLDSVGPALWCGYSYSWLANMKARAKDGECSARALEIFAKAFCLPNSFHVNGDQTKSGYSGFTYRPFTLEGNFAFAAGLQEMLLQSYAGFIEIMPAVPDTWKDISYKQLRAEGAFLIDAKKINGQVYEIKIVAEKGGETKLKMPFNKSIIVSQKGIVVSGKKNGFVMLTCKAGGYIVFKNGN